MQSETAVAILDEEFDLEIFFDKTTGDEMALKIGIRKVPNWEKKLNKLFA